MNITNEQVVELLNGIQNKFDEAESTATPENEQTKAFCTRVDTAYQIATAALSLAGTISSFYFPPLSIAIAGALVLMSALHYYDKKNNYELSNWAKKKYDNVFGKKDTANPAQSQTAVSSTAQILKATSQPKQVVEKKASCQVIQEAKKSAYSVMHQIFLQISIIKFSLFCQTKVAQQKLQQEVYKGFFGIHK